MALTTQGSSLSTLSRAPRIPESVGQLDVKAIYDGVRQGLAAFENVRRAPASMALADADTRAKTLEAPMGTVLAEEAAKQAPLRTQILAIDANTAQQMKDAQIAGLTAKAAPKPLTGKAYHFDRIDKLRAADPEGNDPAIQQALKESLGELAQNIAAEKNATTLAAGAARNATSIANTAATTASREGISEADRQARDLNAEADRKNRLEIATAQNAKQQALATAKTDAEKAKIGRKAELALSTGKFRAERVASTIDKALTELTGSPDGVATRSSIPGGDAVNSLTRVVAAKIPGTRSADLAALVDTVMANVGFDELSQMRRESPTGGALGNVTERELAFLQATVANLKLAQTDEQLVDNLKIVRNQIIRSWNNVREAYERDFGKPMEGGPAAPAPAQAGSAAQATPSAPPTVTTKAQYDALPPNAPYTDAQGVLRRKVGNG